MTAAVLILAGLVFSSALSYRVQKKGPLLLLVLSSYGLRVLLALSFFIISTWHLPVLPELQIEGGFWQFAPDAASHHAQAAQTAEAWGRGEPLVFPGSWYLLLIALLYHVSGPSPLHAALLNAWADSLTIIFGYLLALRLASRRAGLRAAALIAFWPSSLIWSTQLLKESFSAALIMGVLCAVVWLGSGETEGKHPKTLPLRISLCLAMGSGVAMLTCLRPYMGVILLASVLVAVSLAGIVNCVRREPVPLWAMGGVLLVLWAGLFGGRLLRPGIGPLTPGPRYHEMQELEEVALVYRLALGVNPRDPEAWYRLGGVRLRQRRLPEAVQAYRHYDNYGGRPAEVRRLVQRAIPQIDEIISRPIAEWDATACALLAQLPPKAEAALDYGDARGALGKVVRTVARETAGILQEVFLARLDSVRKGSVSTGGRSLFDPEVTLNRLTDVVSYIPRGLAYTLFAPFPWQWFDTRGSTGRFKSFAAVEVISVYLLFPVALQGLLRLVRRKRGDGVVIVVFTVVTATLLSLTIANVGTLFRLRMQCLLPLLVITGIGGSRATHPGSLYMW